MGWVAAPTALKMAPMTSGVYKIGIQRKASVETLYIGVTRTGGSLRETLLRLFSGVEGDQGVMEFVSSAWNKRHLRVDWETLLFPKDDIGDVLRHHIALTRRVPRFNQRLLHDTDPYVVKDSSFHNPDNFP